MSIRIPKYRFHKGSGQALVQINGCRIYLGTHGSEESKEKYQRTVAEWLSNGQTKPQPPAATDQAESPLTISELILKYWQFAKKYYSKEGKPTKELTCMQEAIRPLRQLYGHSSAAEFGPKALRRRFASTW
jgi:hypothetical protein